MDVTATTYKLSLSHLLKNEPIIIVYKAIDKCENCCKTGKHHPYLLCDQCHGVGYVSKMTSELELREEMKQHGTIESKDELKIYQTFLLCEYCLGSGVKADVKDNTVCQTCQGLELASIDKIYKLLPSSIKFDSFGWSSISIQGAGNYQMGKYGDLKILVYCEYEKDMYQIDWKSGDITMKLLITAQESRAQEWTKIVKSPDGISRLVCKGNKLSPLYFSNQGLWGTRADVRGTLCVKPYVLSTFS
jgi:DnaJ-class molecular chaperone